MFNDTVDFGYHLLKQLKYNLKRGSYDWIDNNVKASRLSPKPEVLHHALIANGVLWLPT